MKEIIKEAARNTAGIMIVIGFVLLVAVVGTIDAGATDLGTYIAAVVVLVFMLGMMATYSLCEEKDAPLDM